jgi:hypothetical protein
MYRRRTFGNLVAPFRVRDVVEEGERRVTQLMKKAAIAESREQRNSVEGIVVPVGKHAW